MKINIVNFARNAKPRQLRWLVGNQLVGWIQEMLCRRAAGEDAGKLIDELAEVCGVNEETKVLP